MDRYDCGLCQGYPYPKEPATTNPPHVLKCIQIRTTKYQCLCGIIKAANIVYGILHKRSICVRYNGRDFTVYKWSMPITSQNMQVPIHEGFEILDCNQEQTVKKVLTDFKELIDEADAKFATQSISTQTDDPFIDCNYIKSVETTPIYDYSMIKKQHQALHCEFKAMYRIFSRLILIRYS